MIAANIDASEEPTLAGLIPKSVTVELSGRKVGIIGYVTSDTPVREKEKRKGREARIYRKREGRDEAFDVCIYQKFRPL